MLTIINKESGLIGNNYSFNFGGASAKYTYEDGRVGDNASSTATIEGIVNGVDLSNHNAKPIDETKISTDELTFDQKMQGTFSDANAVFKAGTDLAENGKFEANKVQLMAYLNGELFQTANITLSGDNKTGSVVNGSGYQGLGSKIAGGTQLVFHKVGAKDTDIGFQITAKDKGITLRSNNLDDLQHELNMGAKSVSDAIKAGEVKLSIVGASYAVEDFGLNSVDQFFAAGEVRHSTSDMLDHDIGITDQIGVTKAQGAIKFMVNAVVGDQLAINGTAVTFGKDVDLGGDIKTTGDNLIQYLNSSANPNISQAMYYASDDVDNNNYSVVIQYKEAGSVENSFSMATNNTSTMHLNDLTLSEAALGDVGATQAGAIDVAQQASTQVKINSNFTGTEYANFYIYTPGYAYSYNFTIIGEGSNVNDSSDTVIKITGATSTTDVATQITDGINNYINNNSSSELHQLEFTVVGDNIEVTSKEAGRIGNNSYLYSYYPSLISSTSGSQYIPLRGGTDSSRQIVTPGNNVIVGTDLEQSLNLPITSTLQGEISNLGGAFHEGAVNQYVDGKLKLTTLHLVQILVVRFTQETLLSLAVQYLIIKLVVVTTTD